jgi:hypothetical protein
MTDLAADAELDVAVILSADSAASPPPWTTERRNACSLERWDALSRWYWMWDCGVLVVSRPFTDAENVWASSADSDDLRDANEVTLLVQARSAFLANRTYLAKVAAGTAVNADHIAQVPALTRQMQGVIRLLVANDLLDSTS